MSAQFNVKLTILATQVQFWYKSDVAMKQILFELRQMVSKVSVNNG